MRIKITIQGVQPLLMNRFYEEAAERASSGSSLHTAAGDKGSPLEQATLKLYTDSQGNPVIPGPNLHRCIYDGGKFFKAGKKQITTAGESMLCATTRIFQGYIPVVHKDPWRVDTRPIVNPTTKGRRLTHRPMFDDWQLTFDTWLNEMIIGEKLFRQIVDAAGDRIGLGDFRPARKGPFGRFVVTEWVASEDLMEVA